MLEGGDHVMFRQARGSMKDYECWGNGSIVWESTVKGDVIAGVEMAILSNSFYCSLSHVILLSYLPKLTD